MIQVAPVILCGGAGTRLWPLSRVGFPKQFLCLTHADSLFQQAARRLEGLSNDAVKVTAPLVVTGDMHRFLALEQMREIGILPGAILVEPKPCDTAPALTLAALAATAKGVDPVLIVTPADHAVVNVNAFTEAARSAIEKAADGGIAIFGVKPDRPETGYGYIQAYDDGRQALLVERFVEKPNIRTAQIYLEAGNYFWNAGLFVLKASAWLSALNKFRPDIYDATKLAWNCREEENSTGVQVIRPGKAEFCAVPAESADRAVMENCPGSAFPLHMVRLDAGWSDLGSWETVLSASSRDEHGNACMGDVLITQSCNTLVHASSRLVGVVGVRDLIVVETPDAVLVADKTRSQDVKSIVVELQTSQRDEQILHRKVHRPWGWYDTVDQGEFFKVKRIQVNPGASLSLQRHHHRSEHWIVVKGIAEVTCGDKVMTLNENQSTYISLGEVHRLANPGSTPLEIIEVQTGSYLGEDDIVRLEDTYGRINA